MQNSTSDLRAYLSDHVAYRPQIRSSSQPKGAFDDGYLNFTFDDG